VTIVEAGQALRRHEVTCVGLTQHCLDRIEDENPKLNAFVTVTAAQALHRAGALDAELSAGRDRGPLHGIPIAHKDLIRTRGVRTTCGSPLFADDPMDVDAAVAERLENAGAVMVGKTGLHELAYGITSANPYFGAVRNPHDPRCIPGGSSGGSGAAVSTGMALGATGTDTGGSIRIPASFCGVTGLKPTYGLVSTYGIQPLGLTLDHAGPMAQTVADTALMLDAMAGFDARDPASVNRPRTSYAPRPLDFRLLRIGMPRNFYFDEIAPETQAAIVDAAQRMVSLGAKIVSVELPDMEALNTVARTILLAEATAVYRRRMARRDLFGDDVFALLEQGLMISGPDYVDAQRLRLPLCREFRAVFDRVDFLFAPATPMPAPRIGQKEVELSGKWTDTRLATTRTMRAINVTGLPAMSLPCPVPKGAMPIGLQIVGKAFDEARLLSFAAAVEDAFAA
jgi:aspartyl-tRNA(Asn)/glutamyl-tRNA(Gln) amidotransferase subunit A